MSNIKISESTIELTNGRKGKIAIITYVGAGDHELELNRAVSSYAAYQLHSEFIDINKDNPYIRVIIYDINSLPQEYFDSLKHKL